MAIKWLPPDDPREWLNRARSNLLRAAQVVPGVYLEDLCYDAQQATEKALKAVFVHRGWAFPYTHNLTRLLAMLEQSGLQVPKYVRRRLKRRHMTCLAQTCPRKAMGMAPGVTNRRSVPPR